MCNVLYKTEECQTTDEDCSDAEAGDYDQGKSSIRHGCGGRSQHTV